MLSDHRALEVATSKPRWPGVDAARGVAVVLMLADHLLVLAQYVGAGSPALTVVRLTVTRASLPLFMLCSGSVLGSRGVSLRRLSTVFAVALVVNAVLLTWPMGIRAPEILLVWCVVMACSRLIARYPVLCGAVGVVQLSVWHVPWSGYQPGLLVVCVALGVLAGPACLEWASDLPNLLVRVGRAPLWWYCGHLSVLVILARVLT